MKAHEYNSIDLVENTKDVVCEGSNRGIQKLNCTVEKLNDLWKQVNQWKRNERFTDFHLPPHP